jgi:hypothetical protein
MKTFWFKYIHHFVGVRLIIPPSASQPLTVSAADAQPACTLSQESLITSGSNV